MSFLFDRKPLQSFLKDFFFFPLRKNFLFYHRSGLSNFEGFCVVLGFAQTHFFCFQFDKFGTKKSKTKPPKLTKKPPNGPQGPKSASTDVEDPCNEALEEEIRGLKTLRAKEFDKKFEKMLVSSFCIVTHGIFLCRKIFSFRTPLLEFCKLQVILVFISCHSNSEYLVK